MCSKFPLSNGLQYWLHPLYRLQFALSNDFVLAATCVSMFFFLLLSPGLLYWLHLLVIQRLCAGGNMCIHFYSYCYPTVFYTGYNYSLSNDFILAAIYVSLSLISIIQRFRNTGDTIYTKTKPLPPFFDFTFLLRYLTSFLSHYILSAIPPPSPSSFFLKTPLSIFSPMFPSP